MTERYSKVAAWLHWIIAILIVMNFVGAQIAEDMPKATEAVMMARHKAIGITVLILTLVRISWRLGHRPPPLDPHLKAWEKGLAHFTHGLFYFLMLAIPMTGWMMSSAHPMAPPIDYFTLFDFPKLPIVGNKMLGGIGHEGHEILTKVMFFGVILHVVGALKHGLIDKRPSLARISPFGAR